jgi:hypothetical protein
MPGNEVEVAKYLFKCIGKKKKLKHLGPIKTIGAPSNGPKPFEDITSPSQIKLIKSDDANKKADIYINGKGVSVKQRGGSFLYNRLQREDIPGLFEQLKFARMEAKIARIDKEVCLYHKGKIPKRNRPWQAFFTEPEFKKMVEFLMMKGSPNLGISKHPAALILVADKQLGKGEIEVYKFNEFFSKYKNSLKISIRRVWIGQGSTSEHRRAISLAKKIGNRPWVFKSIGGEPKSWRKDFPKKDRRTVYLLMIEQVK